jgi:NADPH:quinone reductase-like Zn-dependent oxidoreductase
MIVKSDGVDLKKMVGLFQLGKLKVCVDEHFPFDKVPDALSKSLTARSGGKLVIDIAP